MKKTAATFDWGKAVLDAEETFLRLGNTTTPLAGAELISNPHLRMLAEANQIRRIRAGDDETGDRLVGEGELRFRELSPALRRWVLDPDATPARFGEFLGQAGYVCFEEEGLLREEPFPGVSDPSLRLREIRADEDWDRLVKFDISSSERRLSIDVWEHLAQLRRRKTQAGKFRYQFIERGEETVGVVGLFRTPSLGLVEDLYIQPEHRDRGIGRDVLRLLGEGTGKSSALGVICPADESESEFYTHMGFRTVLELMAYEKR